MQRLGVVCRIVNMLVYMEPTARCAIPPDLVLAPLPASKRLWEASDASAWKAECERDPGFGTAFGLAANGDLVRLDEGQLYWVDSVSPLNDETRPRRTANWDEWCAGMDAMGGIVMLAASLLG